jgi:EmrB/QacA subfamily drug resistance transporter
MAPSASRTPVGVLVVLLLAGMSFALAQTMVAPTIPILATEFGTTAGTASWLLTGFLVSASVCTPIVGKLGDLYGRGRALAVVLAIFSVGSIVCALAPSIGVAIGGRVLQGVAGGVFPLAFGIIRETFPLDKVATGIGTLSATFGIGGGLGLPLSGVISDNLDSSWLFWVGLLALPAAVAAWTQLPHGERRRGVRIDWLGSAVLSVALASVLLGVSQGSAWGWGSAGVLGLIALGLAAGALWVQVESRVDQPMVDLRVLRSRPVAATNLTGLLIGFAMFSSFLLVPQLAQTPEATGYGFGASVTESGLILMPSALMMLFCGPLAARLGNRFGFRAVLIAGTLTATASFAFQTVEHGEVWHLVVGGILLGVAISFSLASMANLVVAAVDPADVGIATGINTISRTVGGAFGGAAITAILTGDTIAGGLPAAGGYTAAFAAAAVGGLVATLAALSVPREVDERAAAPAGAVPAPAPAR